MPPVTSPMTGRTVGATTSGSVSPRSSGQDKVFLPDRTRLRDEKSKKKIKRPVPPGRGKISSYNNGDPVKERSDFRMEDLKRAPLHITENAWLRALRAKFGSQKPVAQAPAAPSPSTVARSEMPTQRMAKAPSAPGVVKGATAMSKPLAKRETQPVMPSLGAEEPEKMTADPAKPKAPKPADQYSDVEKDLATEAEDAKKAKQGLKLPPRGHFRKAGAQVATVGPQPLRRGTVRSRVQEKPPLGLEGPERRSSDAEDPAETKIQNWMRKNRLPYPGVKPPKFERRKVYKTADGGTMVRGGATINIPKSWMKN